MAAVVFDPVAGSSPRARGTWLNRQQAGHLHRFIPAGAGNINPNTEVLARISVHPRGRGEHADSVFILSSADGSSPRARGTCPWQGPGPLSGRFIPAGAGNIEGAGWPLCLNSVHPRGRGEHAVTSPHSAMSAGSSPRARGTLGPPVGDEVAGRFIPAGAGNISRNASANAQSTVHPRGRGEHTCADLATTSECGSSPRARGTLVLVHVGDGLARFIPAGAGNIHCFRNNQQCAAVHPRGRGEHFIHWM